MRDAPEVISAGGEDGVGGVAGATFEITAADVTFGLEVADHGLDSGAAAQFAFDDAEHGALLAGDEDAAWILRIVSTVPLTWGVSAQVVLFSCA